MKSSVLFTLVTVLASSCSQDGNVMKKDRRRDGAHLIDDSSRLGENIVSPWHSYKTEQKSDETMVKWLIEHDVNVTAQP